MTVALCYTLLHNTSMSITVMDGNKTSTCNICDKCSESERDCISLDKCEHTVHIRCMIEYANVNRIECPICKYKIDDIRISIAVAFKRQSLPELIDALIE